MAKALVITAGDGSQWAVPVEVIARDRAKCYADEFGGDVDRSLSEDTLPLFEADAFEVEDWAANNMNWSDVEKHATKLRDAQPPDMQEAWMSGEKRVVELTADGRLP